MNYKCGDCGEEVDLSNPVLGAGWACANCGKSLCESCAEEGGDLCKDCYENEN